jgi:hypothetical protein
VQGTRIGCALRFLMLGGDTRQGVVQSLIQSGLTEGAAQVEASTALTVLGFAKLIRTLDGRLMLMPN